MIDKITILEIKDKKITDVNARKHIKDELNLLRESISSELLTYDKLRRELYNVNCRLWNVEDKLRKHEKAKIFDINFIELARSVYHLNDRRAEIKRVINTESGSRLFEEKSYEKY